jgi:hypothetical protein
MDMGKIYKQLPRWSVGALVVDAALFLLMHFFGKPVCGGTSTCYRLAIGADRFADYFALIVAVMAILIPVAIELWKTQFVARNLSPKSPLESAWSDEDRMRYLYEPVASLAIFVGITALLPLFISSTALFYAAVAYGVFLLVYVFYASFFMSPLDIYGLAVLNPQSNNLPPREIMNELAVTTLEQATDTQIPKNSSGLTWAMQLTESKTLSRLLSWLKSTLTRHLKGDFNKMSLWSIVLNFISKCDISTLWLPSYDKDGEIRTLFADEKFYQYGNLVHSAQILKTITERFADSDSYYETIGTLLSSIPTNKIDAEDLVKLLNSTLRILFLKSGENDLVLSENLPDDWLVTVKNAKSKLPSVTTSIYLQWIWSLQMQSGDLAERSVQETTEVLFPEVETILFAKFVLLRINLVRFDGEDIEQSAVILDEAMRKWHIFGNVGRVTTEWTPAGNDEAIENQWRRNTAASEAATLDLIKELGWFNWNKSDANANVQIFRSMIAATNWPDSLKKSWNNFADILQSTFDNEDGADNAA